MLLFKRKKILGFVAIIFVMAIMTACATTSSRPQPTDSSESKLLDTISIGTSSVGATIYTIAVGMADIISKNTSINANAEAVGGSDANVRAIGDKRVELALLNSTAVADGFNGTGSFTNKVDMRVIAVGQDSFRQIVVRADAGINSPEDLVNKKFIARRKALSELELVADAIFDIYGVDKNQVEILETAETNEAMEALKMGTAHAAIVPGGVPAGFLTELAHSTDIKFLSLPKDKLDNAIEKIGPAFHISKIPAGTYRGQNEDVLALALSTLVVVRADISEETVYEITKALMENNDDLKKVHNEGRWWTAENSMKKTPAPFHPGAVRYFKEIGAWTAEMDTHQQQLLK